MEAEHSLVGARKEPLKRAALIRLHNAKERKALMQSVPRITPTQEHLQALVGRWKISGETVRLEGERDSGVLIAVNARGERVNPVHVISRGVKIEG